MKPKNPAMKPQVAASEPEIWAISVAGLGGQGTVLAGVLLGQAAVAAGRWASQSAVYTVAARGGLACSEVLVASAPISCPLAEELHVVLALATLGLQHEEARLVRDGLAILDEGVEYGGGKPYRVVTLPLSRLAVEAGSKQSANLAALGALVSLTPVVPAEILAAEIAARFGRPEPLAAYWAGYEAARRHGE